MRLACLAVCTPSYPEYGGNLDISLKGSTCSFDRSRPCPNSDCTCRNLFPAPCGSLNSSVTISLEDWANPVQYVASWLQTIGINDVQTLFGDLRVFFQPARSRTYGVSVWNIDIFPKVEVITGELFLVPVVTNILPGSGFSSLRVTGGVVMDAWSLSIDGTGYDGLTSTDLAFLSRLECPGDYILGYGARSLTSLRGLERCADGLLRGKWSFLETAVALASPRLTNVTALSNLARCGPNQRPDESVKQVSVQVTCGTLNSWSKLCNYIARGSCA